MKIGIISDIHCNLAGLQGALRSMGKVDVIFCAGDAVFGYRFSNEVIDIIRTLGMYMVMGNHDHDFLKVYQERNGSNGYISPKNMAFLERVPMFLEVTLGGKKIFMTHASPFEPFNDYLFRHNEKFKRLGELDADIVILGHTHIAVVERIGKVLVINPGSCGEARDPYRPYLTYALLDLETEEAKICTIDALDESRGLLAEADESGMGDVDAP